MTDKGKYTVEEGAEGPVGLALITDEGPSSCFFLQMEKQHFEIKACSGSPLVVCASV